MRYIHLVSQLRSKGGNQLHFRISNFNK